MNSKQADTGISRNHIEETSTFSPVFSLMVGEQSIVPVIVQEQETDKVLMLAYMNQEALQQTIETGKAVFYSRSRDALWYKGKTSGNVLEVSTLLCDCDQDALLLRVHIVNRQQSNIAACHTGRKSCFYRSVNTSHTCQEKEATLTFIG